MYNLPKKERQELAKQKCREAYYAKDWAKERDGNVAFKRCTYVPTVGGLRSEIIKTNHYLPWAGHFGVCKILNFVSRKYYRPGMRQDVIQYVQDCAMYAQTKPARHKPWGTTQSLPLPQAPWTDLALHLIVGLPEFRKSDGGKSYNSIPVIVDRFSKMARYIPVCETIDAAQLASILVHKSILQGAGVPSSIVSDQGPQFTSKFWSVLCYHLMIKH